MTPEVREEQKNQTAEQKRECCERKSKELTLEEREKQRKKRVEQQRVYCERKSTKSISATEVLFY